jgi:hypothetical protein
MFAQFFFDSTEEKTESKQRENEFLTHNTANFFFCTPEERTSNGGFLMRNRSRVCLQGEVIAGRRFGE